MKTATPQVTVSIGDFSPLFHRPRFLFQGLQNTGADGIELWVGVKSRWTPQRYKKLADQYNLPIVSLHQPLWAMAGVCFDEGFFMLGQKLGVQHITCHPLPGVSLSDKRMLAYFKRLAAVQERIGIPILIENLPQTYRNGLLHRFFPPASDTSDVVRIYEAASAFGLGVTLDTDHVHLPDPHNQLWFDEVLPHVGNIHLSSFGSGKRHLPPYMGELQATDFIDHLHALHYAGTLTLEIGWPKAITILDYDFEAVRRSIALLHDENQG
jgi:sugar phosphate isomerase/epimerase